MTCPICNVRKEKRFCLALHDRICAQCCGEQREVSIECPSECPYLQQARLHEKPRELADMPAEELFRKIGVPEQFLHEQEPLIGGILQTLGKLSAADHSLKDRDIIHALANMAKGYETLVSSGLVYAETSPNPVQQSMIAALRALLQEYREVEHRHRGYTTLKDGDILKALVFVLRLAHLHTSGRPLSRAFLDFLHAGLPAADTAGESAEQPASRIILP